MNLNEERYSQFTLVREMMDTVDVADEFHPDVSKGVAGKIKKAGRLLYLCAGWNLLVEIGLASGINLDKPERARKVGNEFIENGS